MINLINLIIGCVIFIFPAFVANGVPTILGKGKRFNAPIALLLGLIVSFELVFNMVFLVHIGSFILQIAILDYIK